MVLVDGYGDYRVGGMALTNDCLKQATLLALHTFDSLLHDIALLASDNDQRAKFHKLSEQIGELILAHKNLL